jgi:hypothetical protein
MLRRPTFAILVLATIISSPAARAAPATPDGYERAAATDALVFRPAGERDADVEIRVYAAAPAPRGPAALLQEWIAAHPAPGPLVGEQVAPSQPAEGIGIAGRVFGRGKRSIQEAIAAIRTPDGNFQIYVTRLPSDRTEIRDRHMQAAAEIGKMIARGEAVVAAAAEASAVDPRETAASIVTVGFVTKTRMGIGGSLTFEPAPIVLFRSGEAVDDMAALSAPGGLAAHRAQYPTAWTRWRRNGGQIEIERQGEWKKLNYPKTLDPLPGSFRLEGAYERLSGAGDSTIGGKTTITGWSQYRFDRSGAFTSGGGISGHSSTEVGGDKTTVTAYGQAADERGRYEIGGYVLTLRYDSGKVQKRILVADASDPSVIWLDGLGFVRK